MKAEVWIDGKKVRFIVAHVRLVGDDGSSIQIGFPDGPVDSVRVSLVDADGDIQTECPLTEARWRNIARHG